MVSGLKSVSIQLENWHPTMDNGDRKDRSYVKLNHNLGFELVGVIRLVNSNEFNGIGI